MTKNINFINLTPHPINIIGIGVIIPSGNIARVTTVETKIGEVVGISVMSRTFMDVQGIPPSTENTIFIVSSIVLSATNRTDVVAPDTGNTAIRNDKGHITGVTQLIASKGGFAL